MKNYWEYRLTKGAFKIVPVGMRWTVYYNDENLGLYDSPTAALKSLMDGHCKKPSIGEVEELRIPHELHALFLCLEVVKEIETEDGLMCVLGIEEDDLIASINSGSGPIPLRYKRLKLLKKTVHLGSARQKVTTIAENST